MRIRDIEKRVKELDQAADRLMSVQLKTVRDEKSYLYVNFASSDSIKMPLIPLRGYQLDVQKKLFMDGCKRFFLVRPRRSGKEVESWNMLIQGAIERPGLYLMIYPTNVRARIVLWDGAISLPDGRGVKFMDMIPKRLISSINRQEMSLTLINGSVIRILGSDIDPDKLRGVNVLGAVLSEYAFSDPRVLQILMPVFRQNNGWFIIQTTFNGMNHAYDYMQEVRHNPDWYCRVDSVENLLDENGNRYITDEMIEDDRRSGMPEWFIQQEYYSTIQLNQEILYFAYQMDELNKSSRISHNLSEPGKHAFASYDLGVKDPAGLMIFQLSENYKPVVLYYYEKNNMPFSHFLQEARQFCTRNGLILHSHYLPHDGNKRGDWDAKTLADHARDSGEQVYVVPRLSNKHAGIELMRQILPVSSFEKDHTQRLRQCLSAYSKEFDSRRGIYKNEPLHNWASHGVDTFQTACLAIDQRMINVFNYEVIYNNTN